MRAAGWLALGLGAAVAGAAAWWRKHPSACPYGQRFWIEAPHPFITRERLHEALRRNTHPDADVPSPDVAYHSGGLYEVLIGLVVFAIAWPLRHRLRRPTAMVWLVKALLAAGRFVASPSHRSPAAGSPSGSDS